MTSSSRRLVPVLVLAALLAALAVAPSASAKQKGFKYGVTAADVTPRSAIFWARTTKPGKAWLQLARNGKLGGCHPNRLAKGRGIKSKKKNDLTIQRQIGGLEADQGYNYRFCMKGGRYSATGHFVTAPRKSARTPTKMWRRRAHLPNSGQSRREIHRRLCLEAAASSLRIESPQAPVGQFRERLTRAAIRIDA